MSDQLQKPAVIDIDAMLQPISEESPSGESLRYSGIYDEINEARRADDNLNQGAWQTELKVADYRTVIDLAVPAITTRSKDLQIAAGSSQNTRVPGPSRQYQAFDRSAGKILGNAPSRSR